MFTAMDKKPLSFELMKYLAMKGTDLKAQNSKGVPYTHIHVSISMHDSLSLSLYLSLSLSISLFSPSLLSPLSILLSITPQQDALAIAR